MLAEGRITNIAIDKDVRVQTAWDLGVSDSTAIWFIQCVGRERRLVDYYEASGVGLDHYAQVLHDKRIEHGWKYGDHYFPHDITVRELSSGISRVQSLAALGIEAIAVPQAERACFQKRAIRSEGPPGVNRPSFAWSVSFVH